MRKRIGETERDRVKERKKENLEATEDEREELEQVKELMEN